MYRISSLEIVCPSLVPRAGSECTALLWLVAAAGLLGGLCTKGGSSLLLPTSSRKDWRLLAVGGGWPEVLLESTACGGEEESLILEVFPGWAKLALSFTGLWDLVIGYLLPAASDNGRPLPLLVTPSLRCPVSGRIRFWASASRWVKWPSLGSGCEGLVICCPCSLKYGNWLGARGLRTSWLLVVDGWEVRGARRGWWVCRRGRSVLVESSGRVLAGKSCNTGFAVWGNLEEAVLLLILHII